MVMLHCVVVLMNAPLCPHTAVKRFHLDQYTLTSLLKASGTQLLLGNIHWAAFLGVALYIALGYNLTSALFRRRELEF